MWPINSVFHSFVQCHAECISVHKIVCKLYLRCLQKCLLVSSCTQDTCGAIEMSDLNRNQSDWTHLDKTCHENLSSGSSVVLCHQRDRQTCGWTAVSIGNLQDCDWAHKIVVWNHLAVCVSLLSTFKPAGQFPGNFIWKFCHQIACQVVFLT